MVGKYGLLKRLVLIQISKLKLKQLNIDMWSVFKIKVQYYYTYIFHLFDYNW
jgi:hypothetical protein